MNNWQIKQKLANEILYIQNVITDELESSKFTHVPVMS